jgi:hypothetical protein
MAGAHLALYVITWALFCAGASRHCVARAEVPIAKTEVQNGLAVKPVPNANFWVENVRI